MKCACGRDLTSWDMERKFCECCRCFLIRVGAISSNRSDR